MAADTKKLTICVETFEDDAGFVAWIENEKFKGLVVQSDTLEGVFKELLTSIKVKIAHDYGIEIGGIDEKIKSLMQEKDKITCDGKQQLDLMIA